MEKFGELSKENLGVQRRKYICKIYKKKKHKTIKTFIYIPLALE